MTINTKTPFIAKFVQSKEKPVKNEKTSDIFKAGEVMSKKARTLFLKKEAKDEPNKYKKILGIGP